MSLPRGIVAVVLSALVVITALAGSVTAAFFFDQPWLSYRLLPLPAAARTVRAGESMPIRVVRCNSSDRARVYTIARSLQRADMGPSFVLPDSVVSIEPGCHDSISLANRIPLGTPPGRYQILGLSRLSGLWRDHYVEWSSEWFEVVPP